MDKTQPFDYKKYYEQNKEKIKERSKAYREKNKEALNMKSKNYYSINAEKIKQRRKKIVMCNTCGIKCTNESFTRHVKSQKHLEKLKCVNNICPLQIQMEE